MRLEFNRDSQNAFSQIIRFTIENSTFLVSLVLSMGTKLTKLINILTSDVDDLIYRI